MRQIFVNLPVKDLERSKSFFSSSASASTPSSFTPRAVADAKRTSEMLLALSCSSDREVDYRSFEDPDGHIWELFHMRGEPK